MRRLSTVKGSCPGWASVCFGGVALDELRGQGCDLLQMVTQCEVPRIRHVQLRLGHV